MGDVIGRLFSEFAITLAVTIVISAVVSLTLVPMLCARSCAHRRERQPSRFERISERLFDKHARRATNAALRWVLEHQRADAGRRADHGRRSRCILYMVIPKGLFPTQDVGVIQGIKRGRQLGLVQAMVQRQQGARRRDPERSGRRRADVVTSASTGPNRRSTTAAS